VTLITDAATGSVLFKADGRRLAALVALNILAVVSGPAAAVQAVAAGLAAPASGAGAAFLTAVTAAFAQTPLVLADPAAFAGVSASSNTAAPASFFATSASILTDAPKTVGGVLGGIVLLILCGTGFFVFARVTGCTHHRRAAGKAGAAVPGATDAGGVTLNM